MRVSMRNLSPEVIRGGAGLALAVLAAAQLSACASASPGGMPVPRAAPPPEPKPPKLNKSARQLTRAELSEYLDSTRSNKRRTQFRGSPDDFRNGAARRRARPALGGGTTIMAIAPEIGNYRVDTTWDGGRTDFEPGKGIVVARMVNEGPGVDSATNLAVGDTAYWFVERDPRAGNQPGPVRSAIVRADGRHLADRSYEVCHRPPPFDLPRFGWREALADFIDPVTECVAGPVGGPPPDLGGMGATFDLASRPHLNLRAVEWIPCAQGCCIGR